MHLKTLAKMYIYGYQDKESLEEYQNMLYIKHPAWHSTSSWIAYLYDYEIKTCKLSPGFQADILGNFGDRYFIGDASPKVGDIFQIGYKDYNFDTYVKYLRIKNIGDLENYPYIEFEEIDLMTQKNSWKRTRKSLI